MQVFQDVLCMLTNFARTGDECGSCQGDGLIQEKKTFEVVLDKGAPDEHKVVLRGEAGCPEPGVEPGDLIFLFTQVCNHIDIARLLYVVWILHLSRSVVNLNYLFVSSAAYMSVTESV